ncbi:MAG TPA: hypothetical protein PKY78_06640 [Candidatus Omnitrophota bacterium]|nr:hypothetical protein [Candidatus Omnitrophota bacterium]HPS20645.1 hypothetical protein [Candidatus Omnitrophota bacterium]
MKKMTLRAIAAVTIMLFAANGVFAQEQKNEPGKFDGHFVMQYKASYQANQIVTYYIIGAAEALQKAEPETMKARYINKTSTEIAKIVKEYYTNIPEKRDREVTELLLSGCR